MDPNQPTAQIIDIVSTDEIEFEYSFFYFKAFRDISFAQRCRIENCAKQLKIQCILFVRSESEALRSA